MKYDKPFPIPNYDMKQTADEILQKHEDANEMHFHQVLGRVNGIGPTRAEKFGAEILQVIKIHMQEQTKIARQKAHEKYQREQFLLHNDVDANGNCYSDADPGL